MKKLLSLALLASIGFAVVGCSTSSDASKPAAAEEVKSFKGGPVPADAMKPPAAK